ncbi:MAG: RNA-binding domain-containing protein, partial [Gemmatimonadales bacterium]
LNRIHPDKDDTAVLDFANTADEIKKAFKDYYETTILSEATDPNLLYRLQGELLDFGVYSEAEVEAFAVLWFSGKATQAHVYAALAIFVLRFRELGNDERRAFRGLLTDYVRQFAFLSQILPFTDASLEKLYQFGRHLRKLLPLERERLPLEVQQSIDMESFRLQKGEGGPIALERGGGVLDPIQMPESGTGSVEEMEALSRIIAELNERFGLNLEPEHRLTLGQMLERLDRDDALEIAARVNTRENVRLTFDQKVESVIQDSLDANFELYKKITNDKAFGEALRNLLFDQYLRSHRNAEELIKRGESKTLEFKSTLRWSIKENKKDDAGVTHAVLKTIAAFLNTEGGDLLIGVSDNGAVVGVAADQLESDDKFMRHLAQVVRNGLGDRAGTCIDPRMQLVEGKTVCVVTCQRSPEPVYLRWTGQEKSPDGDFFVRSGPGTVRLESKSAAAYVKTRFPTTSSGRD